MTDSLNKPKDTATADGFFVPRIRGLRESAFWILAGLSVILLLALLSYNPVDPAFSVAGGDGSVANRMGPAGAWFADVAFLLVGETAYLFPVLVLIAGVFLFRNQDLPERGPMLWRGAGFLLTIATSSGLATLHFDPRDMRETAGGILGQLVGRGLEHGLGMLGATVLLLVLWLAAVSLATGVSWLAIMDRVGRAVYAGVVELNICDEPIPDLARRSAREAAAEEVVAKVRAKPKAAGAAHRADDREGRSQRARRARRETRTPGAAVRAAGVDRVAAAVAARRAAAAESAAIRRRRSRRCRARSSSSSRISASRRRSSRVHPGPVITRFEMQPAPGIKGSQICDLDKDIARGAVGRQRARGRRDPGQVA